MKEFLRLDNKLDLKLKIKPKSPLLIKLGGQDGSLSCYVTTETGASIKLPLDKGKITEEKRKGEIYIPGSTLKGLFRDRYYMMFHDGEYEDNLFGFTNGNLARKSRFFVEDAFFFDESKRKKFYKNMEEAIKKYVKTRAITPTDQFSAKPKAPLTFEYVMEDFLTEVTINNVTSKDLKGIFFLLRDSQNSEIRIGSSKNRGFGEIEFEIEELRIENHRNKKEIVPNMDKYFTIDEARSIKLGDKYLRKVMLLKDQEGFIGELFGEVR